MLLTEELKSPKYNQYFVCKLYVAFGSYILLVVRGEKTGEQSLAIKHDH